MAYLFVTRYYRINKNWAKNKIIPQMGETAEDRRIRDTELERGEGRGVEGQRKIIWGRRKRH